MTTKEETQKLQDTLSEANYTAIKSIETRLIEIAKEIQK